MPIRGRSGSTTAMPHLLKRVPTYSSFASKTINEIYTPQAIQESIRLEINTLDSMLFRNDGKGKFIAEPLPFLSQMAPVMDLALADVNQDGLNEIIVAQNFNSAQRETGRMNAGLGVVIEMKPDKKLSELWPRDSGFHSRSDPRRVIVEDFGRDGKFEVLLGQNNGKFEIFQTKPSNSIKKAPKEGF